MLYLTPAPVHCVAAVKCTVAITAAVATPEHLHLREVMLFDRLAIAVLLASTK
jgi:hypothetical protein